MPLQIIVPVTVDAAIIKEIETATLSLRTATTLAAVRAARQQLETLRQKYRTAATASGCR